WALASLVIGLIGLAGIFIYIMFVNRLNTMPIKISAVCRRDSEAMSYIATYLLPFIVLPSSDLGDSLSLGIFLFVLCILYVNTGMIHINPTLSLVGWHIYEITRSDGELCALLSRGRIKSNSEIKVIEIGSNLYMGVK
ncbi:MAG: hypothetical protein WAW75_06380, partial [Gallionella sp.]